MQNARSEPANSNNCIQIRRYGSTAQRLTIRISNDTNPRTEHFFLVNQATESGKQLGPADCKPIVGRHRKVAPTLIFRIKVYIQVWCYIRAKRTEILGFSPLTQQSPLFVWLFFQPYAHTRSPIQKLFFRIGRPHEGAGCHVLAELQNPSIQLSIHSIPATSNADAVPPHKDREETDSKMTGGIKPLCPQTLVFLPHKRRAPISRAEVKKWAGEYRFRHAYARILNLNPRTLIVPTEPHRHPSPVLGATFEEPPCTDGIRGVLNQFTERDNGIFSIKLLSSETANEICNV